MARQKQQKSDMTDFLRKPGKSPQEIFLDEGEQQHKNLLKNDNLSESERKRHEQALKNIAEKRKALAKN